MEGDSRVGHRVQRYEVMRDSRRIGLGRLRKKVEAFQMKNPELSARDIRLEGLHQMTCRRDYAEGFCHHSCL